MSQRIKRLWRARNISLSLVVGLYAKVPAYVRSQMRFTGHLLLTNETRIEKDSWKFIAINHFLRDEQFEKCAIL